MPRLRLLPDLAPDEDAGGELLREVASGLAEWPEISRPDSLVAPLGLSLWMERHQAGMPELCDALVRLREGILTTAALEASTEPVPLVVRDLRTSALNLAAYLSDLLNRAAASRATTRQTIAEEALVALSA